MKRGVRKLLAILAAVLSLAALIVDDASAVVAGNPDGERLS